ncbi:MAG: hypothetical protein K9L79_16475, partial [Methylobacter tundripaludum]|nr:hypothetical protein [Methylobacter tundripaludum]
HLVNFIFNPFSAKTYCLDRKEPTIITYLLNLSTSLPVLFPTKHPARSSKASYPEELRIIQLQPI